MSLSKLVTTLAEVPSPPSTIRPDYVGLVRFLIEPLLESPSSLKVDCEILAQGSKILLRIAFEGEDRGRAFGRGGRNIQAIRTTLQAVAKLAQQQLHVEVFGGYNLEFENDTEADQQPRQPASRAPRSPSRSRPRRSR